MPLLSEAGPRPGLGTAPAVIGADEARVAYVVTSPPASAAKDTPPAAPRTRAGNASARSVLYPGGYPIYHGN